MIMQDVNQLWDDCLRLLQADLTESAFNTWFRPIQPVSYDGATLVLMLRSQMVVKYIEENYIDPYSKAIFRVFGPTTRVEYRILIDSHSGATIGTVSDGVDQQATKTAALNARSPQYGSPQVSMPVQAQLPPIDSRLNPTYTFETFVAGECNKLVRSVSLSAAKEPGRSTFNPLFIYGGSGVGKTHLMNAIGNQVKQIWPDKRVLYLSANEFKTQFMDAAQRNQVSNFIQFYQTIDVLLIDDIQFLAGPTMARTQEQFFHIFNYLHQSQKQIVMTSDRSPLEIKDLEDRLLTRMRWGFQGEMDRPDYLLRKDILRNKMLRDGIDLSDEIINYIAENVRENVRDLEGVLASILARAVLLDQEVTLDLVMKVVEQLVDVAPQEIRLENIIDVVSVEFGVSDKVILGDSRQQTVSMARQVAMYLAKQLTSKSYVEIGNHFNRTHATVLHAVGSVNNMIETNQAIARRISKLENMLKK